VSMACTMWFKIIKLSKNLWQPWRSLVSNEFTVYFLPTKSTWRLKVGIHKGNSQGSLSLNPNTLLVMKLIWRILRENSCPISGSWFWIGNCTICITKFPPNYNLSLVSHRFELATTNILFSILKTLIHTKQARGFYALTSKFSLITFYQ
jgi:hypothetical protein